MGARGKGGDTHLVDGGQTGSLGWGREVGTAQFPESSSSTALGGWAGTGVEFEFIVILTLWSRLFCLLNECEQSSWLGS